MSEYSIRITRLANGYTVEIRDPEIVKQNNKPSKGPSPYRDPCVSYAFSTSKEVFAFLQKNLDKALPENEYESSFNKAMETTDDD